MLDEAPRIELPVAVDIESLGIGGPSAGLMYALGIVELLDETDLTSGRKVAGTGEIAIDGRVGPVGGVRQKVLAAREEGAEVFLVPRAELADACSLADTMKVVGVETLKDAVRALRDQQFATGRSC
jgi:PDZ domain-containing protein